MHIGELRDSAILVCGGTGFLGSHLVKELEAYGCDDVTIVGRAEGDVRDWCEARDLILYYKPDYVFNLLGWNGGIAFSQAHAADIFFDNTLMNLNLLLACVGTVKKVVSMIASCAYPEQVWEDNVDSDTMGLTHAVLMPREIMSEKELFDGPPHRTVDCHGYAKRNVQLASRFVNAQYGLTAVTACPPTLYGEGDYFDSHRTKVVGGLITRFCDAVRRGEPTVTVWGSGKPLRELCYVKDCAHLLVDVMLHYNDSEYPLNIGTGQEVSIAKLAEMIAELSGFKGSIVYDTSKPDGQMRKRLDRSRMKQYLPGPHSFTPLEYGLRQTIEYYNREVAK